MSKSKNQAAEIIDDTTIMLEEARLQIGDLLQLQCQGDDNDTRYSVKLIGLLKGCSVLTTMPMVDDKYMFMREGRSFVLRTFAGKSAYAFTTHIIKNVYTPFPYLHLSYPKEVRSLIVRKGSRANVKVICAITSCDDIPTQLSGTIINISIGGAQVLSKKPLGLQGQQLQVKFKGVVNNVEVWFDLKTLIRIVNVDQSDETDALYTTGLQFVDTISAEYIHLLAYVYHELLEQSLSS